MKDTNKFSRFLIIYVIILVAGIILATLAMYLFALQYEKQYPYGGTVETEIVETTPEPTAAPEDMTYDVDAQTRSELQEFADGFVDKYYNFFGTVYADYYYPELCQYVKPGSDLQSRMDQALEDRTYVQTGWNDLLNCNFKGAKQLADGSYEITYGLEIVEHATYWTADEDLELKIYVEKAPDSTYGYLATATE